jgi:hypothetical protein
MMVACHMPELDPVPKASLLPNLESQLAEDVEDMMS